MIAEVCCLLSERAAVQGDRIIDALCEPPENFVLGSAIAHVLTSRPAASWLG